jgi:hypothetical protein
MTKTRITAVILLAVGVLLGLFIHFSDKPGNGFVSNFGLDINGVTHLVYLADL